MHKLLLVLPLVAIMFDLGLKMTEHGIVALMRRKGLAARGVLVSAFLVPAIALVFIELLDLPPVPAIGLFLVSVAAGPPGVPLTISAAKGDVPFGLGLSHLLAVLTIVTAPALTNWVAASTSQLAETAQVKVAPTIGSLILLELIPITIGMHVRRTRPKMAEQVQRPLLWISVGLIGVVLVFVVGRHIGEITRIGWRGLIAGVMSGAASALLGYGLGGPNLSARKTLALSAQGRDIGLALALASSAFPHRADLIAAVAALWLLRTLLNMLLGRLLASREDRRPAPSPVSYDGIRQRRA